MVTGVGRGERRGAGCYEGGARVAGAKCMAVLATGVVAPLNIRQRLRKAEVAARLGLSAASELF